MIHGKIKLYGGALQRFSNTSVTDDVKLGPSYGVSFHGGAMRSVSRWV